MSKNFEDFGFNKQVLSAIADAGYQQPTPIQQKAIPPILNGQDVLGIAQTGTGKTAAYVLPIIMKLKYAQGNDIRSLIVAPTRELAMQIDENVKKYATYTDLRSYVIYGGLGPKTQIENLGKGLDILIATPGRFMDLYLDGHINTKKLQVLVLDEADKMMDMGFMPQINKILEVVPRKRQNMLFSATMSERVEKLAENFLLWPTKIEVTPQATPATTVEQVLYHVPNFKTKINLLKVFVEDDPEVKKLIIFCRSRATAENVYRFLVRRFNESHVKVLHANKGQNTRINSINAFKNDEVRILVATDVAARGIDVSDVSHVINFDVPIIYEDYVHRIGRTGRAYNSGKAVTFCNEAEVYYIRKIEKLIRQQIPQKEIPKKVFIEETPFAESQAIARQIDEQKRKENPDFKGAFHEKKTPAQRAKFKASKNKNGKFKTGAKKRNR
ncbi:DEAD/DEAH box helicase [Pelobium manganitolerans]|uniref:DEAD/DEAH box helicase n=1 Tax=Pelobium manganitolerans TaxID=1842495 RepID=A0A419S2R2_9SPHI|nr:DEAD/DEAH box helicase [Pelobium manganitolerans]RKD13272.1 DEAD/DEAH box helicase [Pelobium manganitolerans]